MQFRPDLKKTLKQVNRTDLDLISLVKVRGTNQSVVWPSLFPP